MPPQEPTAPGDSQRLALAQEKQIAHEKSSETRVDFLDEPTSDMHAACTRAGSSGGSALASIIEEAIEDAQAFDEAQDDLTRESQPNANPIFAPEEEWEEFANAPLIGQA